MTKTGDLIKSQRAHRKLSQKMVADYLGCNPVFISRIEGGICPLPPGHVEKIARILQVPKEDVLSAIKEDAGERAIRRVR